MLFLDKRVYKNLTLLFFIILLFSKEAKSQAFPYRFSYLTVDDGLSHTDANDIAQDSKGFIWVATFFGLDRYDGYALKQFYNSNEPLNNAFKNRVNCIYPDKNGDIWLGSEDGLQCFRTRTETYIDFKPTNRQKLSFTKIYKPTGNIIYTLLDDQFKVYVIQDHTIKEQRLNVPDNFHCTDMVADQTGQLYLSSNLGIWVLDSNNKLTKAVVNGVSSQRFSKIYFDDKNNLVLTEEDTAFFSSKTRSTTIAAQKSFTFDRTFVVPNHTAIKNIVKHGKSDYWINTGSDLIRLDKNLSLIQTINNKSSGHSLNSNVLKKIFLDQSECLWVCTFGGGVNYIDLNEKLFYTFQNDPQNSNSLSGNHIRSVLADGNQLWIGTTINGLNKYNFKTQTFTHYSTKSDLRLKSDEIDALTFDNDHNLWIGSSIGIQILKSNGKELWLPKGSENFPKYVIDTFVKDYYGNIWFGNHSDHFGVIWKDEEQVYHVKYYGVGYFIFADKNKPQLFISSTNGLKRIVVDKTGNILKEIDYRAHSKENSLSSDYTYPISKQNDSTYWIGTIGGGLNKLILKKDDTYEIKIYDGKYGIFNDVESMEIDDSGNIWMGGNGLERFNPISEKLVRYDKKDGLQGNSFKVGSSYKGDDGRLYFGGINGLNYFMPSQIKLNQVQSNPILTDILINNHTPSYGDSANAENNISTAISYVKKLTLNYLQNNFVISFSAMHFANPSKCIYRYKLQGFDKDWNYTDGKKPSAAYSNLDYSTYKFILEATNNDGIWGTKRVETLIKITPPWWKSAVAKLIYLFLFISVLIGIYIYQSRWYRLKREIAVRAINEEQREEMHKQKEELYQQQLMFFTNISHEFRTPLTLILGPLENLITQNKDADLNNSYQLMLKNAKRLINLISELMNFKKVADSVIKLQVQPVHIQQFCKDLAKEFQNLAISKDIRFTIVDLTEILKEKPLSGFFDVQVLEKILFNLLNNSFKYTEVGGEVSFAVSLDLEKFKSPYKSGFELLNDTYKANRYIYFRVSDSGIGISEESITKIFERYYRISKNHLGSGVGLALVKSLTQLHKGNIYIHSERNKGTEIIIGIPLGEENYTESEKATKGVELVSQIEMIDNSVQLPIAVLEQQTPDPDTKFQKRILLVDDNTELRTFLRQIFEKRYHIYEAEDGLAAIDVAINKVPDLIISDVMMPKMNGIELCRELKERFETSHIPFIILSAKDALNTKIEGMESGADYYFSKPLSTDLLLLTVNNIFEQAEKLKQKYTENYLSDATELVHTEKDKEFLNKLLKLIEDNIEDPKLDVEFLCNHLFLSRTKLYQKIKGITDQSVGEFIRSIRLKKAIQIMTHEYITINEVADRIGLQSSSNFSRAFKREYGKSPLQFMQSLKKQ